MGGLAQCALVLKSRFQPGVSLVWPHGQAVAERIQLRAVRKVASRFPPSPAPSKQLREMAREGDREHSPGTAPVGLGAILYGAASSALEPRLRCGRRRN